MPKVNNPDIELYWLFGVIAAILLFGLLVGFCIFINDFSRKLKYINCEIGRTNGAERMHWIRQRRRLWLSLIPFTKH